MHFRTLQEAMAIRMPQFKNKSVEYANNGSDWSDAQWLQALVGELGEYANLKKKIERGDFSLEEKRVDLGKELADVTMYLVILASRLNIDLDSAIVNKFNEVSERIGADVFLGPNGIYQKRVL